MGNVGAQVYNMESVGFVSRESPCLCDFPAGERLNGVQEVGGSNPLAPILSPIASITCEGNLVTFRALGMHAGRLDKEICPFSACRGQGLSLSAISIASATGHIEWKGTLDPGSHNILQIRLL